MLHRSRAPSHLNVSSRRRGCAFSNRQWNGVLQCDRRGIQHPLASGPDTRCRCNDKFDRRRIHHSREGGGCDQSSAVRIYGGCFKMPDRCIRLDNGCFKSSSLRGADGKRFSDVRALIPTMTIKAAPARLHHTSAGSSMLDREGRRIIPLQKEAKAPHICKHIRPECLNASCQNWVLIKRVWNLDERSGGRNRPGTMSAEFQSANPGVQSRSFGCTLPSPARSSSSL